MPSLLFYHTFQFKLSHILIENCVIIFFWSSGITDCRLFTFENRVPLMRKGASVEWHLKLPLMNSFSKIEGAIFPFRLCFLRALPSPQNYLPLPLYCLMFCWTFLGWQQGKGCKMFVLTIRSLKFNYMCLMKWKHTLKFTMSGTSFFYFLKQC